MKREEKKQARVDKYNYLANKAAQQANTAYERSNEAVKYIPLGQPILVGHHSEKRHRNALQRSANAMDKCVELHDKAEYYRSKAKAAENNNNIYSDDENAEEKLKEKIEKLEAEHAKMLAVNKIVKSKKLTEDEKIEMLKKDFNFSEGTIKNLLEPRYNGVGIPTFSLTNSRNRIKHAQQRLKQVQNLKNTEQQEEIINGVNLVINPELNRIQLFFPSKPNEDIRTTLKKYTFRWSPSNECWQSYLNRYQIDRAKEILNNL